jgi:hypothetical protein
MAFQHFVRKKLVRLTPSPKGFQSPNFSDSDSDYRKALLFTFSNWPGRVHSPPRARYLESKRVLNDLRKKISSNFKSKQTFNHLKKENSSIHGFKFPAKEKPVNRVSWFQRVFFLISWKMGCPKWVYKIGVQKGLALKPFSNEIAHNHTFIWSDSWPLLRPQRMHEDVLYYFAKGMVCQF